MHNNSSSINELLTALSKAQSEFTVVEKDSFNPQYRSKFASLDAIVDMAKPVLSKYGLSVQQHPMYIDNDYKLLTILGHSSGQYICSDIKLYAFGYKKGGDPVQNDQTVASSITYMRRITYTAILGIICDEDNDGQATPIKTSTQPFVKWISSDQKQALNNELMGFTKARDAILKKYNIPHIGQLPENEYTNVMEVIKRYQKFHGDS